MADQDPPSDFSDAIFARRLREFRTLGEMTQQQLANVMADSGHRMHRSAIAKIESGERPVTIGEAVQFAGALGVPLMEMITDPGEITDQERAHRARVEAQLAVRSLSHQAWEYHRLMEETKVLYENTIDRLEAARRRLRELGGELPFNDQGLPPGLPLEVFDPKPRRWEDVAAEISRAVEESIPMQPITPEENE
jgi:transcriptional regulator with XRE-family HTH domain